MKFNNLYNMVQKLFLKVMMLLLKMKILIYFYKEDKKKIKFLMIKWKNLFKKIKKVY